MDKTADIIQTIDHVLDARRPEDLFGILGGDAATQLDTAKRTYYRLAQKIHPDKMSDPALRNRANNATKHLNHLWDMAQGKIQRGTYGTSSSAGTSTGATIEINTRRNMYLVSDRIAIGDLCNVYHCTIRPKANGADEINGVFKVARRSDDNDLVSNEARILRRLHTHANDMPEMRPYLPQLAENFTYRDSVSPSPRQANVLHYDPKIKSPNDLYSLKEVREHYHSGVEPADMAWMWRRVLVILGFAHKNYIIHGAILPTHILIEPDLHGLVLIDWAYAVHNPPTSGERISAISSPYEAWYPEDVFKREQATPGLDIFMAARCMVDVLGGDAANSRLPDHMPTKMKKYFEWCMSPGARMRPQDAWQLLEEFDTLIESLWGPRQFRPFEMPRR